MNEDGIGRAQVLSHLRRAVPDSGMSGGFRVNIRGVGLGTDGSKVDQVEAHAVVAPTAPGGRSYSQAVVVGDLVFVAGTVGVDMTTRKFPDGIVAQMELALRNLADVLAAAGCGLENVVKTTTFITPAAYADDDEANAAEDLYAEAFTAEPKPARSSPMVALPIPEALVSIEAIAVRAGR